MKAAQNGSPLMTDAMCRRARRSAPLSGSRDRGRLRMHAELSAMTRTCLYCMRGARKKSFRSPRRVVIFAVDVTRLRARSRNVYPYCWQSLDAGPSRHGHIGPIRSSSIRVGTRVGVGTTPGPAVRPHGLPETTRQGHKLGRTVPDSKLTHRRGARWVLPSAFFASQRARTRERPW